jgi:DNA processing protein
MTRTTSASGNPPTTARAGGAPYPAERTDEEQFRRAYADGRLTGGAGPGPSAPWEERLARIALTRTADPGDAVIGATLRERGPQDTLAAARTGRPLPHASPRRTESYAIKAARADPLVE